MDERSTVDECVCFHDFDHNDSNIFAIFFCCRDEAGSSSHTQETQLAQRVADGAPEVQGVVDPRMTNSLLPMADARRVTFNLPKDIMHAPVVGPASMTDSSGLQNHWAGQADDAHLNSFAFDDQYHNFVTTGIARGGTVVDMKIVDDRDERKKSNKKRRVQSGDRPRSGIALDRPFVLKSRQPWAQKQDVAGDVLTEEQQKYLDIVTNDNRSHREIREDVSIFHGPAAGEDYLGRSWIDVPPGLKHESEEHCFLPKRVLHTWSGHSKGVNVVRFWPGTGHLLLSGGLDGKAKVWSVYGSRQCMRTYLGHTKGIRDVWFAEGGAKFLTAAYDKSIKLWDTETGTMLQKFGEGHSMAYCIRTNPDPSQPDVLLAGMQNKKILQFDMRTGDNVQEYNYHMDAVNTLTFVDEGKRFLSTSDDKTIRVWEFGVPVQTQCIKDPSMHAISSASLSTDGKYWLGQSADNQVVTYSIGSKIRQNRKKSFEGHACAGYACQVGLSHDGQYVYSGDGDGKLFIWSWKSKKMIRSLNAHERVCIGCEWHPLETSKVVTCGWDGVIKLWD